MGSSVTRLYGGKGGRIIQGDFSALYRMSKQLSRLAIGNQGGILAAGMDVGTSAIAQDAKSRLKPGAGVDTGALKASLDNKVVQYKDSAAVIGLVGPKVGAFSTGERVTRIKQNKGESRRDYKKRTAGMARPTNYAHLVEFGHRSVHGGGAIPNMGGHVKGVWNSVNKNKTIRKGTVAATSYIAPTPFLQPAFDAGINNLETSLADATKEAMEKEFSKLR